MFDRWRPTRGRAIRVCSGRRRSNHYLWWLLLLPLYLLGLLLHAKPVLLVRGLALPAVTTSNRCIVHRLGVHHGHLSMMGIAHWLWGPAVHGRVTHLRLLQMGRAHRVR